MGTVIASILVTAAVLLGILMVSGSMMNAIDSTAASGKETGRIIAERSLISVDIATATYSAGNAWTEVMILNDGKTSLLDFDKWDVFMQYKDTATSNYMHYQWFPYSATYPPGNNQWAKNGIYLDVNATVAEQYEPGILNPAEYLKLAIKTSSSIKSNTWVYIKASTPQGVNDSIQYKR